MVDEAIVRTKKRLLIVNVCDEITFTIEESLMQSYKLSRANSLGQLFYELYSREYDLIICSYQIPGSFAIHLAETIKSLSQGKPLLFLAPCCYESEAIRVGISFLEVPYSKGELLDIVQEFT